jgi:uncharacterized protein (TIGR02271 family)
VIGQDMVNRLYDAQVVDPRGEKIGSVKRIWLDGQTGDPLWASVHTGLFGLRESFVPLQRAELRDDKLRVPVDKEQVKESPRIEASGDHMSDDEQAALCQHYGFGQQGGMGRQQRRPGSSQQSGDYPNRGQHGRPDRGTQQGQQDQGAMTRSEEQLTIGAERVETGRVRLVKHVVTEEQQVSVPVSHEEVRIEREPITGANRGRGAKIGEAEQETVSGTVRKEQIDIEDGRENDDGHGGR